MKKYLTSFRLSRISTFTMMAAMCVQSAWALDPFKVRDIRIEGLQRVEPGTVFASLPIRIGDTYNDETGSNSIRSLFALGLFKDVRLEAIGDVLVIAVEERQTIADVSFVGFKEFDKEAIKKGLRESGLAEGRPYDKAITDRAEQEIKSQYVSKGLYNAEVTTTVTPIERNRVNLTLNAVEGSVAKISAIRIVGNNAYSESTLLNLFDSDTGGYLSWYTRSNRYSRAKFNADMETLRSFYMTRGFLEFKIDSTQVSVSPNKEDVTLTVNISEGNRFVVSGVKLVGNYFGREDEFKSLVTIKPGEEFNAEQVATTAKAFTDYFGSFGYAFSKVEAFPEIDRTNNRVNLVMQADPQRRVYVRKINISGNNRTRDEVIRREFRQFESSWFNGDKIRLSRDRVDRLGFFKEVTVDTQEIAGAPDQVDINLVVIEKPTGSISLGAGYSSSDKVTLSAGIKQDNAFGSGNNLSAEVNTGKYSRTLALSTTDPYFTQDGVSRTFDAYYKTATPTAVQGGNFNFVTTGTSVRFGVPFSETDTIYFGGGIEQFRLKLGDTTATTPNPPAYIAYFNQYGEVSYDTPITIGWARDSRDSALAPNSGIFQRATAETSPAMDARYVKFGYQFQHYIPLNKQFTVAYNADLGWAKGIQGRPFPVFKNYYGGGLGSVRGFQQGSLGPQDASGNVVGGAKKVNLNAQIMTPFPGAGNDRTLRLIAFVDAGNVWGESQKIAAADIRASAGIGLSWLSPVGPIQLSFARPIKKQAQDKLQAFQFQIGTSF